MRFTFYCWMPKDRVIATALKPLKVLLALLVWSCCLQGQATDLCSQCLLKVPHFNQPKIFADLKTLPITIFADQCGIHYDDCAWFKGSVTAYQGNWGMTTERLQLDNLLQRVLKASSVVSYSDPTIQIIGDHAAYNADSQELTMQGAAYHLVDRQGRGTAERLQQRAGRLRTVTQCNFTTCLPGDRSWQVKGSTITHDTEKQLAEIWNARFLVAGVPLFYSPYWRLPTGSQRRSGFLMPDFELPMGFSRQDFKEQLAFALPYYWDIAPNVDATITPRYMSQHGLQWQLAWRYLITPGFGTFAYEHLNRDRFRYLLHWRHQGLWNRHWHFDIDHTRVSDPRYFSDLKSKIGTHTDNYAMRLYRVAYLDQQYALQLSAKNFQLLQEESGPTARVQPRLDIRFFHPGWFNHTTHFQMHAQADALTNSHPAYPETLRLHLSPTLTSGITHQWGSSQLQAQLLVTRYQQRLTPQHRDPYFKENINRVLPQFMLGHSLLLERPLTGSTIVSQTLEPRIQYLYRPYREQRSITDYDATPLQKEYHTLFSDRQYSGLDRIASANQISAGVTTRWLDHHFRGRFSAAIGHVHYLSKPQTGIHSQDNRLTNGMDHWILDSQWLLNDHWSLQGSVQQYHHPFKTPSLSNLLVEYRLDEYRMAQLSYRFVNAPYLGENYPDNRLLLGRGLSQCGATASWLLNHRLAVVARYYYDLSYRQSIKQQIGFQYNTCCWAIFLKYGRALTAYKDRQPRYDPEFSLTFRFRGLGHDDHDLGFGSLLNDNVLPYQRPLFLPQ